MKKILSDYLNTYTTFPADVYLSKADRKLRHQALKTWADTTFEQMPTCEEVVAFMKDYDYISYQKPFFEKVLFPQIENDIQQENVTGIKFLIDYPTVKHYTNNSSQKLFDAFLNKSYPKYEKIDLINRLLAVEPNHENALFEKYYLSQSWLEFSIHAMPAGILSGKNIDGTGSMDPLYNWLDELIKLSEKFGEDHRALIKLCSVLFPAWEAYLACFESYQGFEDYLIKNNFDDLGGGLYGRNN